jgi:hypothetical protein
MAVPRRPIRYRSNGVILGKRPLGRKVMDEVTGFLTYEAYIAINDYGDRVDVRGKGFDYKEPGPTFGGN